VRFRLLQARLPGDPVREEERQAFAARLGVPIKDLVPFDLLAAPEIAFDPVTDGVDAVLVGGSGAFSVTDDAPWIRPFADTVAALADRGFPTFASCFGFQAMVMGLGGRVDHDPDAAEVGSFDLTLEPAAEADPLFGELPPRFVAQQGHKDRAFTLPSGLVHLARSERCPYQAVRAGAHPVWATQFHPELTMADNRARFLRYLAMYEQAFGGAEAQRMVDAFRESPHSNGLLRRFAAFVADPGDPDAA
jgi:GMP synthase (glutamine-hydrolysing)